VSKIGDSLIFAVRARAATDQNASSTSTAPVITHNYQNYSVRFAHCVPFVDDEFTAAQQWTIIVD